MPPATQTTARASLHGPTAKYGFHVARHISESMCGTEPDEEVDVVRDSADGFRHTTDVTNHTSKIRVQPLAERSGDQGTPSLVLKMTW